MNELIIKPQYYGKNGTASLTVRIGDEIICHDKLNLNKESDREQFIKKLSEGRPGLDADQIRAKLLRLAADRAQKIETTGEKKCVVDLLLELAEECEFFHDKKHIAYATVKVNDHFENWAIKSKVFRLWLRQRLWEEYERTAYSEALKIAIESIESKAIYDGTREKVYIRLAEHDGAIWLDLCNENWNTVQIYPDGWQIFDTKPPVKFIRSQGMLSLPEPISGGTLADLKPFLNVRENDDFVLMVSWLLACLKPSGPYPILCLSGEQGSAKSTACRILRNLVDPNAAPLRAGPREDRDLAIAASNAWLLCYDNISYIQPWLSDAFCRLSTGGGFATRELFTNGALERLRRDILEPTELFAQPRQRFAARAANDQNRRAQCRNRGDDKSDW